MPWPSESIMKKLLKYWPSAVIAIFLTGIFYISVVPLRDFDLWFHVKAGEFILNHGIAHYDVFSYNTTGREWYPYEWLFQITVAGIQHVFGFEAIKYLTAIVVTALAGFYLLILKKIFRVPLLFACLTAFLFVVSIYEFVDARPHIVAYTFLVIVLFFILLYLKRGKNLLWVTIPVTLAWANMHGSIFIDVLLFAGYTVVSWWIDRKKTRTLALFTLITGLLTILPPLGVTQYRLLWYFFQNRHLLTNFIDEWTPLAINAFAFNFYTVSVVLVTLFFAWGVWRTKQYKTLLLLLPVIPFLPLPYTASRNIVLGYITMALLFGNALVFIDFPGLRKPVQGLIIILVLGLLGWHINILGQKQVPIKLYYPVKASAFLNRVHIQGHMFNEYGYGGYLLYRLYPEYKVFYDGRTDLYLAKEMPDTLDLAVKKIQSDDQYKKTLDAFWNKYDISFVILTTQKHNLHRKISHILTIDPSWSLVYWDDYTQIFVRRDGKNDAILRDYGVTAATPYERNPYTTGMAATALTEYQRMERIADSGHTKNAIGYMYLTQGKIDQAKPLFEQAMNLDPSFESPLMNLAEIYAHDGDLDTALYLYQQANKLAPDRGLIYIRLGELIIQKSGDTKTARAVWQEGVQNTVDTDAKAQLKKLLGQVGN